MVWVEDEGSVCHHPGRRVQGVGTGGCVGSVTGAEENMKAMALDKSTPTRSQVGKSLSAVNSC